MKYGSLFSGGGLGDFGFEMAGFDVRWQVEVNDYARKVLDLRWPDVKKYKDIKQLDPKELEPVDLITGGFPCQPFSVAGKRDGADDDRNLWPEMSRIIKALKPRWVVAENVPGIIDLYLDVVLADLEDQGYTCWPVVFSSHALGAWHNRERLWIIAHSNGLLSQSVTAEYRKDDETCQCPSSPIRPHFTEPQFKRFGDFRGIRKTGGTSNRMDRLKAIGNGQTPCSTYEIAQWINEVEVTLRTRDTER